MRYDLFTLLVIATFSLLFPGSLSSQADETLPIVFVPGFKGSKLEDSRGNLAWLDVWHALGFKQSQLALPLDFDDNGQQLGDDLHAAGLLETVGFFPNVLAVDVYQADRRFLESLGHPLYIFSYDWRRDNMETLFGLKSYVERLLSDTGSKRVHLVGHSMGGLLASACMNSWPHLVQSLVLAGVPFQGSINAWEGLHTGVRHGLNSAILSASVGASFISLYSLLDWRPETLMLGPDQVNHLDLTSVKTWETLGLSRFASDDTDKSAYSHFLQTAISKARDFQKLANFSEVLKPRAKHIFLISGTGQETSKKLLRHGPEAVRGWDVNSMTSMEGDGMVLLHNSRPTSLQTAIKHLVIESHHDDLFLKPMAKSSIQEWFANQP